MNWHRPSERLPADGEIVLGAEPFSGSWCFRLLCYYRDDDWRDEATGEREYAPQRWAPIEGPQA